MNDLINQNPIENGEALLTRKVTFIAPRLTVINTVGAPQHSPEWKVLLEVSFPVRVQRWRLVQTFSLAQVLEIQFQLNSVADVVTPSY